MGNMEMLKFCSLLLFVAAVKGQGPPPSDDSGQDCVLLLTSPLYALDDGISSEYINTEKVETVRYNESLTFIVGTFTIKKALDITTRLVLSVLKFANGQESTVMSLDIDLCNELGREDSDYYDLLKYLAIPTSCPIEPGEYEVSNLIADVSGLPINSGNIGDYQAKMEFVKCDDDDCNERTLECTLLVDCVIEMK